MSQDSYWPLIAAAETIAAGLPPMPAVIKISAEAQNPLPLLAHLV